MNAVIIRSTLPTRSATTVVRRAIPQDVALIRKVRQRKGTDDLKSVSSSKSNKTIESLTKQVKMLKKLVSVLQAHNEGSEDDSSVSSEEGDVHFQYTCAAIASTNPNVAMALKSLKAQDLDIRSVWLLDSQSTFDLCCNKDFAAK